MNAPKIKLIVKVVQEPIDNGSHEPPKIAEYVQDLHGLGDNVKIGMSVGSWLDRIRDTDETDFQKAIDPMKVADQLTMLAQQIRSGAVTPTELLSTQCPRPRNPQDKLGEHYNHMAITVIPNQSELNG